MRRPLFVAEVETSVVIQKNSVKKNLKILLILITIALILPTFVYLIQLFMLLQTLDCLKKNIYDYNLTEVQVCSENSKNLTLNLKNETQFVPVISIIFHYQNIDSDENFSLIISICQLIHELSKINFSPVTFSDNLTAVSKQLDLTQTDLRHAYSKSFLTSQYNAVSQQLTSLQELFQLSKQVLPDLDHLLASHGSASYRLISPHYTLGNLVIDHGQINSILQPSTFHSLTSSQSADLFTNFPKFAQTLSEASGSGVIALSEHEFTLLKTIPKNALPYYIIKLLYTHQLQISPTHFVSQGLTQVGWDGTSSLPLCRSALFCQTSFIDPSSTTDITQITASETITSDSVASSLTLELAKPGFVYLYLPASTIIDSASTSYTSTSSGKLRQLVSNHELNTFKLSYHESLVASHDFHFQLDIPRAFNQSAIPVSVTIDYPSPWFATVFQSPSVANQGHLQYNTQITSTLKLDLNLSH